MAMVPAKTIAVGSSGHGVLARVEQGLAAIG